MSYEILTLSLLSLLVLLFGASFFLKKPVDLSSLVESLRNDKEGLLSKVDEQSRELMALREQKTRAESELFALKALAQEMDRLKSELKASNEERSLILAQNSHLKAQNDAQKEKLEELKTVFEEQKKALRDEMNNTMQKILESKIEKFDKTSKEALEALLKPFRENIDGFRKKVEESQRESGERIAALSKEIEQVMRAGLSITQEAANLTKALKGEKQTQGRWGEMVLESVLEHSGLIKGEHYFIQESYKDEEGRDRRPDVIVRLPGEKSIIIDSKVSLVDYDRFVKADSEEERAVSALQISKAFKNHIDTLSSKEYTRHDIGTLQYVFMFVPIEGAYAVAVGAEPNLYEYALKKHIVIVYPSTLVITLKTVYMYWQREKSDEAIEAIYEEAGRLYDKIYGFVESFEKIGRQLESVAGSYQEASKQLYQGNGNLLKRAQNLRALGAKTTKNLKTVKLKNRELAMDEIEIEIEGETRALEEGLAEH